jgi:hypothetical protein
MGEVKYVTEAEISSNVGRFYTCLGYPISKNKKIDYKAKKVRAQPLKSK